jgi:hypothetical protein
LRTFEDVPILENERHELFAQQLAQGKSASEAYVNAGFQASRQNAGRLRTRDDVKARVAELQANAARSAEVSIQSLIRELDDAIDVARTKGQAQAMVSAAGMKAKLSGLMVERQQIEVSQAETELVPHFWIETDFPRVIGMLIDACRERYPNDPDLVEWTDRMAEVVSWHYPTYTASWRRAPSLRMLRRRQREALDVSPERTGISQYATEEAKPANRKREI